jgi:dihydrofolate reductase
LGRCGCGRGDLAQEITRLKQQPGKDVLAHGGAGFAQSLVGTGLIDEFQFLIHLVALGDGLPLFSTLPKPLHLKLVSAKEFDAGAVAHIYQPI